jgi:hypothetical protein
MLTLHQQFASARSTWVYELYGLTEEEIGVVEGDRSRG